MPVYVFYYITGEFSKLAYFTLVLPIKGEYRRHSKDKGKTRKQHSSHYLTRRHLVTEDHASADMLLRICTI